MEDPQTPPLPGQSSHEDQTSLKGILNKCLDAGGYVVFVAVIGKDKDEKGFNLIEYNYRRANFSFEDTKRAIEEFSKQYKNDVEPQL